MKFSNKESPSCFSGKCGLCPSCVGGIGKYPYPGYVDEKPLYKEDNKY